MISEHATPLVAARHLVPVEAVHEAVDLVDLLQDLQALTPDGVSSSSPRPLDRIVGALAQGHLRTTPAGVVTGANRAAAELLGHRAAGDLVGLDVFDVVAGHDRPLVARALQESDRGVQRLVPVLLRTSDGRHVETEVALGGTADGGARLLFARGPGADGTDGWDPAVGRLFRHLPVVGYSCLPDEEWTCQVVTPWVADLLGFTAQRWVSSPRLWLAQVHPRDRERLVEKRVEAVDEARPLAIDYRIRDATGRVRWLHDTAWFEVQRGVVVRAHGLLSDVTNRHRSVAVLEQLCESERVESRELRGQVESLTTLLELLVHDARTPLVGAREWLDAALGDGPAVHADVQGTMLARVREDLRRLGDLLHAVHERQRLLAHAAGTSVQSVSLADLVGRVLAMLDLRDHEVLVVGEVTADVDPFLVERVLANLVGNAVHHSPAGTTVHVRLGLASDDGEVWIAVEDEGDGIPEPDRGRVFDPLFRRGGSGTGMGLAIVRDVVGALGGRVWIEDRPGGGASFQVVLPPVADDLSGPGSPAR